jgi:glutamine synthetase
LRGIDEGLPLPEEMSAELLSDTPAELARRGVVRLPSTLGEAIETFEGSELMRDVLGEHIAEYLVAVKRKEWDEYCSAVTDWERSKYYAGI